MRKTTVLLLILGLMACSGTANANLLTNGELDAPGNGPVITGWTKDESKTLSGPTTDLITLEPWIEIAPITNGGGDNDRGGFVKAFQGNNTTGDRATLHLTQGVPGVAGVQYTLTGMIGAGASYSGLIANTVTDTELAIEFDTDNDRTVMLGSSVLDVQAAGLTSGGCCTFGAQQFSVSGTAPVGTTIVRARFSMIEGYNPNFTPNPDPSMFIDDFSLVPEPTSVALCLIGLLGVVGLVRRR